MTTKRLPWHLLSYEEKAAICDELGFPEHAARYRTVPLLKGELERQRLIAEQEYRNSRA